MSHTDRVLDAICNKMDRLIENQKQILERYAKEHSITRYKFYVDDGISGTTFNRPGFQKMLAGIDAGYIYLVTVKDNKRSQMYAIRDIEEIKERLLSFGKYAENAAPDVLVTLIQTFVERIYITDENDERHCHIFIKGCSKEEYDDFFRATGYIENT